MAFLTALSAGALVAASALWAVILSAGRAPFASSSGTMAGVGLLLLAMVAVAGLLLASGRWARITGIAVGVTQFIIATSVAKSVLTVAAASLSIAAAAMLLWVGSDRRRSPPPSSDRPSPAATALLVGLIAAPALMGLASPMGQRPAHWVAAAVGLVAGASLARASTFGLWLARIGMPVASVAGAIASGPGGGISVVAWGAALTVLAWRPELQVAVSPLTPLRAPGYRIPPQLTPSEILDAGGIDEEGRPT